MSGSEGWVPATEFAQARGSRLAYQVFGRGEHLIVAIPPLAQNIEIAWEEPAVRAMLERFGSFSRYVHFDKRGTGASDRSSRMPGIDERVEDIEAVMDAAGFDRAHFFVQSDGGPMAILFAATYPDRVESLILCGSFAALPSPFPEEERVARRDRYVAEWGTPQSRIVDGFAPSRAADQRFRTWHQRYERHAASMDSLRELLDVTEEMDVTELLPTLTVPTLVIHRTGDRIVPIERGRELAAGIPGAQIIEFESDDHFAYVGDLDEWMSDVERFVTGTTLPRSTTPRSRPAVRIATLGGFSVEVAGETVPTSAWGSRHARQVCKRLVAARGGAVTRDELVDMLWPDEGDRRRLGARLSVQLSAVRRVLGGGVVADRETVSLDLEKVSTDVEDFFGAVDDAAVVAAYPGEFLPEDVYDDWTAGLRDETRTRFSAAARRMADRAMDAADPVTAAGLARRLVDADRYDEGSHRLLVEALAAAGETGAARRAHGTYADAMAELGVEVEAFDRS